MKDTEIVAAPTTRAVELVVHDFEPGWDAYTEKPGRQLPVDPYRALLLRARPAGGYDFGPRVPAALDLLRGRTTAAFPPLRTDTEMAGATFVDAPDVVDGANVSL
ncbi:hypothetical protein [Nonomuraea sp. NPDC050691]|uniref:hypothetical protein n=1 Tax=Nonomuraea sp. NPDC050691 TaxID=3155661 RepID=UPI0033E231E8